MVEPFLMPVSRWFSFADVRLPDELEVLSRDAVSGPGIVTNKAGTTLYVTGHPTVQGNTFHDEYEAELAAGRLTMPPTNLQYVSGRPLATWAINGTTFFENWFAFIGKALGKEQSKL
jgi:homoserine O-succinyltransferase